MKTNFIIIFTIVFCIIISIMKNTLADAKDLAGFSARVGGVFAVQELSSLFETTSSVALHRRVTAFIQAGLLRRYCRGIYVAQEFDPLVLAQKVRPGSIVSLGSALAAHRMIGTESPFLISCVSAEVGKEFPGSPRIGYWTVSEDLLFGYDIVANGVRMADREKSLLDTLYFHIKGKRFHFDIFQDIHRDGLDRPKYETYLVRYRNPKFRSFARRYADGEFSFD